MTKEQQMNEVRNAKAAPQDFCHLGLWISFVIRISSFVIPDRPPRQPPVPSPLAGVADTFPPHPSGGNIEGLADFLPAAVSRQLLRR